MKSSFRFFVFALLSILSVSGYCAKEHLTNASPIQTDPQLSEAVTDAAQVQSLWGSYASTGDIRYVQSILFAYSRIANDNRIDGNDIYTLAISFQLGGPQTQDPKAKAIIDKYRKMNLGSEVIIAALALGSLGQQSTDQAVYNQIQTQLKNSTNPKVNLPLVKVVFNQKYAKLVYQANLMIFTASDVVHASDAVHAILALPKPSDAFSAPIVLNNIQNVFTLNDVITIVFLYTGKDPNQQVLFEVLILQADGTILNKSPSPVLDVHKNVYIANVGAGSLKVPGIYTISINVQTPAGKQEIQYPFLLTGY